MKKLKLFALVLLALVLSLSVISCDKKDGEPESPTAAPTEQTNAPSTKAPDTEAPSTKAPDTEAPDTEAPSTKAPETEAPETEAPLKDITGVTLDDLTVVYDGTVKSLAVKGTLPAGVSVKYGENSFTDAGTYTVKATLSGEGYKQKELTAALTVKKADITGIGAEATQELKEDRTNHKPQYTGTLPEGVSVKYLFNGTEAADGVKEPGIYTAKMVFSGKNYNELTLTVTFKIKIDYGNLANEVIDSFGQVPDAWSFLPEKFAPRYHILQSTPDYSKFVNVPDIPVNGLGKQMNVVYGVLSKADVALSYVNKVYGSMNIIKTLYSSYLDSSPENAKSFTGEAGGFNFTITLADNAYYLAAGFGSVRVEIFSVLDAGYGARVQLTDTTVLKYTVTDSGLIVALNVLNTSSTQIEFVRDTEGNVAGYLYEYLTVGGKELKAASSMIEVGKDYTVVIGTKGDFIPASEGRNCEVYDNATGCFVGSEVRENLKDINFNTYWFMLNRFAGIDSIMKEDKMNGTNADTIYINGVLNDTIHTRLVGGFPPNKKTASRRFDIEFKTMYFWALNAETNEYESVKCEVPMMFIQEEFYDSFAADFSDKNPNPLNGQTLISKVPQADRDVIAATYQNVLPLYDKIKDQVTQQMIIDYCTK